MKKRKTEIALLLTIGAFIIIGITTIISLFSLNQKNTTISQAASPACQDRIVEASGASAGWYWKADCAKVCTKNADCPQNPSDPTPPESNWCYLFNEGFRCMQRVKAISNDGGTCDKAEWYCLGECAPQSARDAFGGNSGNWRTEKQRNCGKTTCDGTCSAVVTTPAPIPGDVNQDRKVDIFDYNKLISDFGKTGTPGWITTDINKDGRVDIFDYNILVGNFGRTQ